MAHETVGVRLGDPSAYVYVRADLTRSEYDLLLENTDITADQFNSVGLDDSPHFIIVHPHHVNEGTPKDYAGKLACQIVETLQPLRNEIEFDQETKDMLGIE